MITDEKYDYALQVAMEFIPEYDCDDDTGEMYQVYPHQFYILVCKAEGVLPNDFPFSYDDFQKNKDISGFINDYNKKIDALSDDESQYEKIDTEKLYYATMLIYRIVENRCTNALKSPDTIRQQLQSLLDHLSDVRRFTIVGEKLEKTENPNGKTEYLFVKKEPLEISGRTLIGNLRECVENLLKQDSIIQRGSIGGKEYELPTSLNDAEIDILDDRTIAYPPSKKAGFALPMFKWLFSKMRLPDIRARKSVDKNTDWDKDERSYSINRLIILLLNMMRYTDSTNESSIKGLISKYGNFDPKTLNWM